MIITFTRKRLRAIIDALQNGRYIPCPDEGNHWEDNELLAVAGACLSHLMFRRDVFYSDTTDEPLRVHLNQPYHRLSARMTMALNYALTVASNIINDCVDSREDKTYMVEVSYEGPQFQYCRLRPDDEDESVDDSLDFDDKASELAETTELAEAEDESPEPDDKPSASPKTLKE